MERTRCNTIRIERLLLGQLLPLLLRGGPLFFCVPSSPEPPAPLLIHFRARRDTVDRHEKDLLRLYLGEEVINIVEDC